MKNDTQEIKDIERQQSQTWYPTALCDRCKRSFKPVALSPDINKEILCPNCKNDIDVF